MLWPSWRRPLVHVVTGTALALVLLWTSGSGVVGAMSFVSEKAPVPKITVKPSKNLHNDEKVNIAGKNFPAKTALVIVECNPLVLKDQPAACAEIDVVSVTTGSKGTFPKTSFEVITGTVGNRKCGTTTKNLTCYIFVSEPSTTSAVAADAAMTFVNPKS